jgi:hypothetical protein
MALLTIEDRKARRLEGTIRAKEALTAAQRVHRSLVNGRPPTSEMKSPMAAFGAARLLLRRLEEAMLSEGVVTAIKHGVAVAFVSPDLTYLGYTPLLPPNDQDAILRSLDGNVPIGLLFGVCDVFAMSDELTVRVGSRPFLNINQVDEWLSELAQAFPADVLDPA